ncbi:putative quinol monooxygenase [Desulfogranum mediterraneum]|uniref:putative quinol monooxygenase n=1 Tax=Desulfogranum mediterraneum TaxID=160661 RepID=UPI00040BBD9C|nr:putative quinol monooxygenase [Desulfogranum mediterraneum]
MIHVIASIEVRAERLDDFSQLFKRLIPEVRSEEGCLEYQPTVDLDTGLAAQELNPRVVTVIERWQSLEHLRTHLAAPHMEAFRKQVSAIVTKLSLKVLDKV